MNERGLLEVEQRDRARAEARVKVLEAAIKSAFLGAVHRGDPCPFCLARTDNVWPFCAHFAEVCVLDGWLGDAAREEIDERQNEPADEKGGSDG